MNPTAQRPRLSIITIHEDAVDQRFTLDERAINAIRDEIEHEILLRGPLSYGQKQFFDYLIGRRTTTPDLTDLQKVQVARDFAYIAEGFPIVETFERWRFPGILAAKAVIEKYDRQIKAVSNGGSSRKGRPKKMSIATYGGRRRTA